MIDINRVAKFEKVSFAQFVSDIPAYIAERLSVDDIRKAYDELKLPTRSTDGSAGYDFHIPFGGFFSDNVVHHDMPTGVKCRIDPGWVLVIAPRSGLGFRTGFRMANTLGVIDQDYYNNPTNEGHIKVRFDLSYQPLQLENNDRFVQGLFLPYGITEDDIVSEKRNGGFGSTGVQ